MADSTKDIKQLTEVIKTLIKKLDEQGKETTSVSSVERNKRLEKMFEEYIEKAIQGTNIKGAFDALKTGIEKRLSDVQKQAEESYLESTKELSKQKEELANSYNELSKKISQEKDPAVQKELEKKKEELFESILQKNKQLVKKYENFEKNLSDTIFKLEDELTDSLKETFKDTGFKAFKKSFSEEGDVNLALSDFKKALQEQYKSLQENTKFREEIGLTEEKLDEVKQEIYQSYLNQLANQSKNLALDEKTRIVLEEKLKKEKILLGQSTYEQTYGRSPLGKLAGRMADLTTRRFKSQTEDSNIMTKGINSILGSFFKGKETDTEFLNVGDGKSVKTRKSRISSRQQLEQKRTGQVVTPAQQTALPIQPEPVLPELAAPANAPAPAASPASAVNETPAAEKLGELQQTLEQATENVPLKTIITSLESNAEKQFRELMIEAFKEALKEGLNTTSSGTPPPDKPKKKSKEEKEEDSGFGLSDLLSLKGLGKGAAKFGKGAAGLARGAYGLATGGLGIGGLLGSNVGAIASGGLGAGALLTSGALAAGTMYAGYQAGSALEENFGWGTKGLQYTTSGMLASKLYAGKTIDQIENEEKSNDELNQKLQKASEIKDPIDKKLAYFQAQKESLENEVKVKSGDEQQDAKKRLESVNKVLVKLENQKKGISVIKSKETSTQNSESVVNNQSEKKLESTSVNNQSTTVNKLEKSIPVLPNVNVESNGATQTDVKPELDTNNKLTSNTNELLGELISVVKGKNGGPGVVAPLVVPAGSNNQPDIQTQSPAYQFRAQNRF